MTLRGRYDLGRGGGLLVQIPRGAEKDFLLVFQESYSAVARSTQQSANPSRFMVVVNYQRWRALAYRTGIVLLYKKLRLQLWGKSIFFLFVIGRHVLFLKSTVTCFTPTCAPVQCRRETTKGVQGLGLVTSGTPLFSREYVRRPPLFQQCSCCARFRTKRCPAYLEITFNFSRGFMDRIITPSTCDSDRFWAGCFFTPYFGFIPIGRSTVRTSKDFDFTRSPLVPTPQALDFFYCSFHPFLYSIRYEGPQQQKRRAAIFQAEPDARFAA